jgi:hypothetical protein
MAAMTSMIATTIRSSIKEKPFSGCPALRCFVLLFADMAAALSYAQVSKK